MNILPGHSLIIQLKTNFTNRSKPKQYETETKESKIICFFLAHVDVRRQRSQLVAVNMNVSVIDHIARSSHRHGEVACSDTWKTNDKLNLG